MSLFGSCRSLLSTASVLRRPSFFRPPLHLGFALSFNFFNSTVTGHRFLTSLKATSEATASIGQHSTPTPTRSVDWPNNNPLRFQDKKVIVTGGGSGIGESTVREFLREGASVAIFDINATVTNTLVEQLRKKYDGKRVKFYQVDVSNKEECLQATESFAALHGGKIHCLVNNAVFFGSKGLEANPKDFQKSFSVNVVGASNMTQATYKYMITAGGTNCAVVNLSSVTGRIAHPQRWTYSTSKGAILPLTTCMARDLGEYGIRVNSISPAWVWTPEVAKAAVDGGRPKWEPIWGKSHMLRRIADPIEVARAVLFLCSQDASFITGTDLRVDGGYLGLGPEGLGQNTNFMDYD